MNWILSVACFVFALSIAGPSAVEVHDWRIGFEATPVRLTLFLDPTFVVIAPGAPASACTFGSTIWIDSATNPEERPYILYHERNHVAQFHALGLGWYPASAFLTMDYWGHDPNWAQPAENDAKMWSPPSWWPDQWHFMRLEVRLG
jgi:hypothetical protein